MHLPRGTSREMYLCPADPDVCQEGVLHRRQGPGVVDAGPMDAERIVSCSQSLHVELRWLNGRYRVCWYSGDAGLQMAVFCASGTHVPKRTLRAGSRKPPFSARPDLNLNTP